MTTLKNQHQDLVAGKWFTLTLAEQLGNVGSDFDRALRWKEKKQSQLFSSAVARTLELLDLTLDDSRWHNHRLKELTCLRAEVRSALSSTSEKSAATIGLQKYFFSMATLARRNSH